jgi:hypothetical protein
VRETIEMKRVVAAPDREQAEKASHHDRENISGSWLAAARQLADRALDYEKSFLYRADPADS